MIEGTLSFKKTKRIDSKFQDQKYEITNNVVGYVKVTTMKYFWCCDNSKILVHVTPCHK